MNRILIQRVQNYFLEVLFTKKLYTCNISNEFELLTLHFHTYYISPLY